ncbi:MAG: LysR family transcriptional regulator [Polyangiaceae bacterium]|nr:LysR family transcriptional regulator [Myxococcales bacterium]MCB9587534.1 LysR family transcriptional regulator [Polyangiaceae bacterium]MCB9605669.1 LysR family transcriptional regulator [Polyangiaceae bacterium]
MSIQWDDLRYLEAVQRLGSVSAAARELGLGQSTLYRRITALEQAIGQPCLIRGTSGATLSDAGVALAQVGRRTAKSLSQVLSSLRDQGGDLEGVVSVTTVEALLPFIQGPLAELCEKNPTLSVSLHLGDSGPSVRDHEVDVALAIIPRPPAGCWGKRVARLGYGVFATKAAAARPERRWVLRPRGENTPEAAWERANAGEAAMYAQFNTLVSLCAEGVGLALMPKLLAARHASLVELSEYANSVRKLERILWVLTHPDRRKTPRIRAVMSALERPWSTAAD